MKKIISFLVCFTLLFCFVCPVFAEDIEIIQDDAPAFETGPDAAAAHGVIADYEGVVTDSAELLTQEEKTELAAQLTEIGNTYGCDILILTVNSLNGKTPEDYADDYFDYNGYGRNTTADGILFMISMEDRDWAISTCGNCIDAFTDNGQEYMVGKMMIDLKANRFNAAFKTYADTCDELLRLWAEGKPYDRPQSTFYKLMHVYLPVGILIALALGFLIATVPMNKLKAEVQNVKWKRSATDYTRQGSMQMYQSYDNFLYTNTSRVKVESSSTRSGSSTHTSSSGRSHGGSSGKF